MGNKGYLSDLKILDKVGYGASGIVYSCNFDDKQYAYKELTGNNEYKEFIKPRLEGISKLKGANERGER
mgnify:CR=1 FL=1